jgi:hypothetical protein
MKTKHPIIVLAGIAVIAQRAFAETPIRPDFEQYKFDGTIGETKVLKRKKVAKFHVGGTDSVRKTFVYEPPPGWTILDFQLHERSKGGDAGYTPRLTAKNSHYAAQDKINDVFENVGKYAAEYNKFAVKSELDETQKTLLEWSRNFESANNHLEVEFWGKSRVEGLHNVPLVGSVGNTITAFLDLEATITIARVMTDAEAEIVKYRLKRLIDEGKDVRELVKPLETPTPTPAPSPKGSKRKKHR